MDCFSNFASRPPLELYSRRQTALQKTNVTASAELSGDVTAPTEVSERLVDVAAAGGGGVSPAVSLGPGPPRSW